MRIIVKLNNLKNIWRYWLRIFKKSKLKKWGIVGFGNPIPHTWFKRKKA
jgi:hypothetical protein